MSQPENVHHEVLPNGLTLLLRETHLAPVANVQIWAKVGSADEAPGQEGLAHFHEHMLFKGTERRGVGEIAGQIEGAGGRVNAYTSFDVTVYYATVPIDALGTGLEVLTDAIRHSIFDPDEIDREIEVVLEEIRRSEDSPGHVLSDAVFREHYRGHPYGAPILGPPENVASFDRDKVTRFWKKWYAPDNLVVVAAGDFKNDDLAREIRSLFEDMEPAHARRERPRRDPQDALRCALVERPFERWRLDLCWPGAAFRDADATYLDLLSFALGECESSRLVRKLREREGLADRIHSSSYTPFDPGIFSIDIESDAERTFDVIRASLREVERVRHEPLSEQELERARINFLASEHFERESVSGLASKLGNFHVIGGDWRSEERYFETLRGATTADLLRVAQEYLDPEQLTAGLLIPESADGRIDGAGTAGAKTAGARIDEAMIAEAVRAGVEEGRRGYKTPTRMRAPSPAGSKSAGVGSSAASHSQPEIQSYEFTNGAQLHVVPRREIPVVACRAAFIGGLLAQDEADAGLSNFLASTWLRGTRSHSAADYARTVEDLAAEIAGFSGRSSIGLTLDVASEKLEPALDLFAEILLEPGLAADELERERRETLAAIERLEDQLATQAFLLFNRTHFREHPYRLPMTGTIESVARFDLEQVRAHHERIICGRNLVIAVAGDVDPDAVAESISRRMSGLPEGASYLDSLPPIEAAPEEIREGRIEKDRAQAHLVLGFRGLDVADPDSHCLEVISQLLAGQSGRLFLELRDRRSLAYTVSAMNIEGYAPGFFAVYIATAPEKVEDARRGVFEELERLISETPGDDELAHAKRHLTGNHVIDEQRNSSHAAHIALDALYGLGPGASRRYTAAIEAVRKEDVLRVARNVIDLSRYTEALVG